MTPESLDAYVHELLSLGLLHREKSRDGGLNLPNRWSLIAPAVSGGSDRGTESDAGYPPWTGTPPRITRGGNSKRGRVANLNGDGSKKKSKKESKNPPAPASRGSSSKDDRDRSRGRANQDQLGGGRVTPSDRPSTAVEAPNGKHPNTGLSLTVPSELVEAIAQRTAEVVAGGRTAADQAAEVTGANGRMALSRSEAAEALGVSVDHLERHVLPELRVVRSGRLRLVPVAELSRWVEENAARALEEAR